MTKTTTNNTITTQERFVHLFDSLSDALNFETQVLGIGDEFLPAEARAVRDGDVDEPSADYWRFLASQIEEA